MMKERFKGAWRLFIADFAKHWLKLFLIIFVLAVTTGIFGTVCYTRLIIGIPCAFCGITRALLLLLQGKIFEAWQMHPLIFLVVLVTVIKIVQRYWLGHTAFLNRNILLLLFGVFFIFYLYRLVEYFPMVAPMDYDESNLINYVKLMLIKIKE